MNRKSPFEKIWNIFTTSIIVIVIIIGTIFAIAYAYGYRLDLISTTLKKTGVLSVESSPSDAIIKINGEVKGRTAKTLGSIEEGFYTVNVDKEGYREWSKVVKVKSELSTPVYADLFLKNISTTTLFSINENIIQHEISQNQNHLFILSSTSSDNEINEEVINIYDYVFNPNFWDLSPNPEKIFTLTVDLNINNSYKLTPSKTGDYLFLIFNINEKQQYFIVNVNSNEFKDVTNSLKQFNNYNFSWANSNSHLILSSEAEILSFNIDDESISLLYKLTDTLSFWDTDSLENFYIIELVESSSTNESSKAYYRIKQKQLNGKKEKILVDYIFTYRDNEHIENQDVLERTFTLSKLSTFFTGKINGFYIHTDNKGLAISTEYALYWYDTISQKWKIVSNVPSKFISFSPDNSRFLFQTVENQEYKVQTFLKEKNEHFISIGSKDVTINATSTNISWLSNSIILQYENEKGLNIVDIDNENNNQILDSSYANSDVTYIISYNQKFVYTIVVNTEEGFLEIISGRLKD